MKTYLTRQGLLVVRDDASFFTSNSGEFRQLATADEVEYLVNYPLTEVKLGNQVAYGVRARRRKCDVTLRDILANMEIPLWHYLWSISNDDYSSYKAGTCNNGGDYSFHEHIHFFARQVNGECEIRSLTTYSTSAEFSYDELNGSFQSNLSYLTATGIAPYELEDEHGAYQKEDEWYFRTQTSSGEDEEISIDRLFDKGSWDMDAALQAAGHYTPERDSDEKEYDYEIDKAESDRRCTILNAIGFEEPTPRRSGRNQRRWC